MGSFKQEFADGPPDVMNLMYAIGMTAELGFHVSRSCFDVVDFPTCPASLSSSSSDEAIPPRSNEAIEAWKKENAASSSSSPSVFRPQLLVMGTAASAVMTTLLSAFYF